jgi:hypothetical protein
MTAALEALETIRIPYDGDVAVDGDAATYLEELVVGELGGLGSAGVPSESVLSVELVGPHLRLAGGIPLGRFRRLSDVLNHHDGLLQLLEATVLRRNGTPTRVTTPGIWVNTAEVTLIGQRQEQETDTTPPEFRIAKERHGLIVVTPGHMLTGEVYVPAGADLSVFIASVDPAFIPMTDVRTRSLADRRIITRYPFAVLNRGHIVAATELLPGMDARGTAL